MRRYKVLVIGGGASGIAAAISAGRCGSQVIICERSPRIGRKVLASGNGRCNLTNDALNSSFYNASSRPLVESVFKLFGRNDIGRFFRELGLFTRSEGARVFPVTDQSSSVLGVLEQELNRLPVKIETGFDVVSISAPDSGGFIVTPRSGGPIAAEAIVIACGGKTYPALGSDGAGYRFAERFGHKIVKPVPAAVPLVSKDRLCHLLQGQRIEARVSCSTGNGGTASAEGDVLFTRYGLSGTAILDISEHVSVAINRNGSGSMPVYVDMVPFMTEEELSSELSARAGRRIQPDLIFAGILPDKFGPALKELFAKGDLRKAAQAVKMRPFSVTGTRGWNEADFTAGGVEVSEVDPATLESRLRRGVYFSGETLDVNGARGGYNLAWAWASGFVAGRSAACAH
jgi:predicted Rossmann fold flavoprotein